ncbi:hypothetical protein THASP1DRAFT_31135 [Thamnocephalis sphaerospora]|uniref:Uncharacterized protein n=1 Tax=Thamnocephalis sphaerospora TaxID=78915 RepID=A0A4P9XMB9_9FUNG|nr:hypothetical protein THASP1DRAFT_31135 [Thamnocephalis sphaerospora]|eukprot:RKP07044.1 hypothetical protein THASP1DRAFT_31135 [Thamnocephalis sphaerospora]
MLFVLCTFVFAGVLGAAIQRRNDEGQFLWDVIGFDATPSDMTTGVFHTYEPLHTAIRSPWKNLEWFKDGGIRLGREDRQDAFKRSIRF